MIPWFSKTEGNTYATIAASPFPLQGKPTQAQDVAIRISGAVAREAYAKSSQDSTSRQHWRRCRGGLRSSQDIPSTHHKLISLSFTLFAICLSFSSPPLHPCCFIRPLFPNLLSLSLAFLFACVLDWLSLWLVLLSSLLLPNMKFLILSKGREKI